ncbi:MAG TPA: hydroxymethylglutaryl-CoA lyase [Ramlibacter sp.]|nr:hydroxymethylglutaryl-CoA lyase [Ramlibacter sp.]
MSAGDLPSSVVLQEEGPREGFQSEAAVAVSAKLELIHALAETGLLDINCVSFVDPRRVPQMADAEEVAAGIRRKPGVRYTGIWLNGAGFERAAASGLDLVPNVFTSVSSAFAQRNNGCSSAELTRKQGAMLERYRAAGMRVAAAHVFTAFGCHYEGRVVPAQAVAAVQDLLDVCAEHDQQPRVIYLCDTVGAANPGSVRQLLHQARSRWPGQEFALHLHDTRGMGLANVLAGLQYGVRRFDTSIGGLGGCPFAGNKAAAGNVCTEDVAFMCEEMGIATGLDLDALLRCADLAEEIVGHPLPGKFRKAGRIQ